MKIETFTLRSNDTGGVAALRQVHPDCGGQNISPELSWVNAPKVHVVLPLPCTIKMLLPEVGSGIG